MNWVGHKLKVAVGGLTIGPDPTPIKIGTIIGVCVKHGENDVLCKLLPQYKGWRGASAIEHGCKIDDEFWYFHEDELSPVMAALMDTE